MNDDPEREYLTKIDEYWKTHYKHYEIREDLDLDWLLPDERFPLTFFLVHGNEEVIFDRYEAGCLVDLLTKILNNKM